METELQRLAPARKHWWDLMEEELMREMQVIRQMHAQKQPSKSATRSTPLAAKKKSAEKVKPSEKKAQPDDAPRNFPVLLTEAQLDKVESHARDRLSEIFTQRESDAPPPRLDPRIEAAEARKKQAEQKKPTEQMETEELEGEPSTVEKLWTHPRWKLRFR